MIVLCILLIMAVLLGGILLVALHFFSATTTVLFKEKIGVIAINGTISSGKKISSQLATFAGDENISAIILRINSPGGGVGATQEIYREVQKTTPRKPVIVSMGSVAASGGYYVAAPATKIVSNPGTITGSIGVFIQFVRLEKLLNKIGVDFEIVKSGGVQRYGLTGSETNPKRPGNHRSLDRGFTGAVCFRGGVRQASPG